MPTQSRAATWRALQALGAALKAATGAMVLFLATAASGILVAECFLGDQNCYLELLLLTVPLAFLGKRLLRQRRRLLWTSLAAGLLLVASLAAIPDSLRDPIRVNEERALRDVRTVVAAEQAYAAANAPPPTPDGPCAPRCPTVEQ